MRPYIQPREFCIAVIAIAIAFFTACDRSQRSSENPIKDRNAYENVQSVNKSTLQEVFRLPKPADSNLALLQYPLSLARYGDSLFVADQRGRLVRIYDLPTGKYLGQLGGPGEQPGRFGALRCVRIDARELRIWVLDLGYFSCFTLDGDFLFRFHNLTSSSSFDILPNGNLVAVGEATLYKGGLALLTKDGEVLRTFSAAPEFTIGSAVQWRYGSGLVAIVRGDIWQVYGSFNQIKVFASNGDSLRTLRIPADDLITTHEYNISRLTEKQPVARILHGICSSGEDVWISGAVVTWPVQGADESVNWEPVLYRITSAGTLLSEYAIPFRYAPGILVPRDGADIDLLLANTLGGFVVGVRTDESRSISTVKEGE